MSSVPQPEAAPTIVLPLPEGGHVHLVVPCGIYERYQVLKEHGVLTKDHLIRLASNDGATTITAKEVIAAVQLPTSHIKRRLAELDRAALAIKGSVV
jgi:hypothetical protein